MDDVYEETIWVGCDTAAVRSARRRVSSALRRRGWAEGDVERAQLAVSELVANAVVHARTASTVHLRAGDASLRLEVVDGAPGSVPRPRELDPSRVGGLGLHLVACLARRWGVDRHGAAKSVWCEVDQVAGRSHVEREQRRAPTGQPAATPVRRQAASQRSSSTSPGTPERASTNSAVSSMASRSSRRSRTSGSSTQAAAMPTTA